MTLPVTAMIRPTLALATTGAPQARSLPLRILPVLGVAAALTMLNGCKGKRSEPDKKQQVSQPTVQPSVQPEIIKGDLSLMPAGYSTQIAGKPCITFRDGHCFGKDGKFLGVVFRDGFTLAAPRPRSHRIEFSADSPVHSGQLSYRGRYHQVSKGDIYDASNKFAGRVSIDGQFWLRAGDIWVRGNVNDSVGIAAELLMNGYYIYDSSPEKGVIAMDGTHYEVRDSVIYSKNKQALGTVNSRGEISWNNGETLDVKSLQDVDVQLNDSEKGEVLSIKRQSGVTQSASQHVRVSSQKIVSKGSPRHTWLGYRMSYSGGDEVRVDVSIKPLLAPKMHGMDPALQSDQNARNQEQHKIGLMNLFLNRRLAKPYSFSVEGMSHSLALNFSVSHADSSPDAEVHIYIDESTECLSNRRCHLVRPSTHQISLWSIVLMYPHEFLHFLDNNDEYPDPSDPDRDITDPSSIMYNGKSGELKMRHLEGLRRSFEQLIGKPVKIEELR